MPPSKWDEEDDESTPPSSPPVIAPVRRGKFDDEEDDSDVVDSWDAAEDSEEEAAKKKAAEEARVKAEAEARANKKSKSQRIEEKRMEAMRRRQEEEDDDSDESEDEAEKRAREKQQEKEGDLRHAEDLFGGAGMGRDDRTRAAAAKPVTLKDPSDPTKTLELSGLRVFDPQTRDQFKTLHETMVPLIAGQNSKKAQYATFATDFVKALVRDLPSEQIKKIASGVTAASNEKLKEEKAADKTTKKTKAQKVKSTLNAARDTGRGADTNAYDDGLDDGDFM